MATILKEIGFQPSLMQDSLVDPVHFDPDPDPGFSLGNMDPDPAWNLPFVYIFFLRRMHLKDLDFSHISKCLI